MKKLVLLFASLCLMATTAFAKEVATANEYSAKAPVAAPAELKPVSTTSENLGDENGKQKKEMKLTTAQKMALKMMKKPLKRASTEGGISGELRTPIILICVGLILIVMAAIFGYAVWALGLIFWLFGAICLVVGLILLLLALLG
jgi:hypothetical protein